MKRKGKIWGVRILAVLLAAFCPGSALCARAAGEVLCREALEISGMEILEAEIPEVEIPEGNVEPSQEGKSQVYLDIDSRYAYEGMGQSFSEGYRPEIKNGMLCLAVPFLASGDLKGDRLTVCLSFPEAGASPFLFKNYQKPVEKKQYVLKNGVMTCLAGNGGGAGTAQDERTDAYLYYMEIPLLEKAAAGQYAVSVRAFGYTEQMERVFLERQIFVSIPGREGFGNQPGTGGDSVQNPDGIGENGTGGDSSQNPDGTGGNGTGDLDGAGGNPGENGTEGEGNPGEGGGAGENGGDNRNGEGEKGGEGAAESGGNAGSYGSGGGATEELIRSPKLLLEPGDFSEWEFSAGSEGEFKATLKNYSGTQPLYNLKATLSAENPGIRFSRNSFYVKTLSPGETVVLETVLQVSPDAAEGVSALVLELEYEDKKGGALSGKETAVLSVKQPASVEFSFEGLPGVVYASDTAELTLQACNVGRAQVFNVRASLSVEGLLPDGEVFLGNLETGVEKEGTMQVYAGDWEKERTGNGSEGSSERKYGMVEGMITFQYEDADGHVYEETKPVRTEIKKAQILSFAVDEPEETNSWWTSVAAAAFAGLLLLLLLLFWRLRKKNRLLAEAVHETGEFFQRDLLERKGRDNGNGEEKTEVIR